MKARVCRLVLLTTLTLAAHSAFAQHVFLRDAFARDLTGRQLTMVDWEGQIANPAVRLTLVVGPGATTPGTATITINSGLFYFNEPSTTSPSGPTKTFSVLYPSSTIFFNLSVYPDRNFVSETHTLTVTYVSSSGTETVNLPVVVVDQDYARPLDFEIITDLSHDATTLFSNPDAVATFNTAAQDWAYFLADMNFDTVPVGAQDSFIWDVSGFTSGNFVSNTVAYSGFLMYGHGVTQAAPPYRSGGQPSLHAFHTIGSSPTPLRRSGVVSMETQGNYNTLGWKFPATDATWADTSNFGHEQNDFYSIVLHEMGHALFANSGYTLFDDAKTNGFLDDAGAQAACGCPANIDSFDHFPLTIDEESYKGAFGSEYEQHPAIAMPRRRWLITKFNLLAMQAVGWQLRPTSAFAPVEITTASLPNATAGVPYAQTVVGSGGVPHYNWTLAMGSLPPGLVIDSFTGAITGTPTTPGSYTFTLQMEEYSPFFIAATKEFTIEVAPAAAVSDRMAVY